MHEYAMVIFADLRGFTKWSNQAAVGPHLQNFMIDFYNMFYSLKNDDTWNFKPNGDGVMIVRSSGIDHKPLNDYLDDFINIKVPYIYEKYKTMRQEYHEIMRCDIPLDLGFGVSAGLVYRIEYPICNGHSLTDFASGTLNVAARLCDQARPEGIVINADAFPGWHPKHPTTFNTCLVSLKGLGDEVPVWVSTDILKTPAPRELRRVFNQEFHVGTICYDSKRKVVVLAKRQQNRELYPGIWETGGGQIYEGENIVDAAKRLAKSEFGIDICVDTNAGFIPFKIEHNNRIIPGIKLLCLFDQKEQPMAKDIRQHSKVMLVNTESLKSEHDFPSSMFIPYAKSDIITLITNCTEAISK